MLAARIKQLLNEENTDKEQVSPVYFKHQVIHDVNQVIHPEDIICKKRYYQVHLDDLRKQKYGEIEITSLDIKTEKYKAKHYSSKNEKLEICELEHSLADFGVVPYGDKFKGLKGRWNTRNWLVLKEVIK